MARAAGQRLRSLEVDTLRRIGIEIEPADVGQDLPVAMAACEFAEAAGPVVDAEFKTIARARLDEVVDEIFREFVLMA